MDIATFLHDRSSQVNWLEKERLALESVGEFFSWWPHGDVDGFGVVVVSGIRSMEFHLMPGGTVTRHLEEFDPITKELETIVSDSQPVGTLEELVRTYADLRDKTLVGS